MRRAAAGDSFDKAVAQSLSSTLKNDLVRRRTWATGRDLTGAVFDDIGAFHNPRRRHSTLGFVSPVQFEDRSINIYYEKETN